MAGKYIRENPAASLTIDVDAIELFAKPGRTPCQWRCALKEALSVPTMGDSVPYGYVQGVLANDFVFVAGQVGVDGNYRPVGSDIRSQTSKTFDNIVEVLAAADLNLSDIVSMTVFLTDLRIDFPGFIEVRKKYFDGHDLPTSAVIGVSALALPELKVEIQAIAARRKP